MNAVQQQQQPHVPLHAVPDQSIVNLALDLSDLEGTNIHLGEATVVAPDSAPSTAAASLVAWLRKGCHATMMPLDGRDRDQMAWLRDVLAGVVGGLNAPSAAGAAARVGLIWRRIDGLDVDLLEEYKREMEPSWVGRKDSWMSQTSQTSQMSARGRPDSGRIKPRTIVSVRDEGELDAVLSECVLGQTIKQDCVVSIVFHDEESCLFSMLHVAVAGTRLSFLNLASLVEEIGQLHAAGRAGDFRLKSSEMTDLNALASHYVRGDARLFVVEYKAREDLSYVGGIVSVCASSQTVWTDLVWLDANIVRRAASVMSWEALGGDGGDGDGGGDESGRDPEDVGDEDNEVSFYEVGTNIEERMAEDSFGGVYSVYGDDDDDDEESDRNDLASCFQSPSIASIRQSLQERVAREMSTAAKRAASKIKADSPTEGGAMSGATGLSGKSYTERRLLFPSLQQSHTGAAAAAGSDGGRRRGGGDGGGGGGGGGHCGTADAAAAILRPAGNQGATSLDQTSRDFFSSLRTIDVEHRFQDPNVESISLHRPTTTGDVHEFASESNGGGGMWSSSPSEGATAAATAALTRTTTTTKAETAAAYGPVFENIEARIHERFDARLRDLTERLEISEMRRIELQSLYDVLKDGPSAGWDFSDHQSIIKSLQEEVKRCKSLEAAMSSMEQARLEVDVELDAKDREIGLLRARIHALESESDVSTAYKLCEEALSSAREECRVLRQENADLVGKLAAVEVSSLMAANGASAILPEDEDYDVDAEARIIYKLHEKLKLATRRSKRLEAENSDLRSKLHEGQRAERVAIVTRNVCDKLKKKVNALQRELRQVKPGGDGAGTRRAVPVHAECFA